MELGLAWEPETSSQETWQPILDLKRHISRGNTLGARSMSDKAETRKIS